MQANERTDRCPVKIFKCDPLKADSLLRLGWRLGALLFIKVISIIHKEINCLWGVNLCFCQLAKKNNPVFTFRRKRGFICNPPKYPDFLTRF